MISSPHPNCDVKLPEFIKSRWYGLVSQYNDTGMSQLTAEENKQAARYYMDQAVNLSIANKQSEYRINKLLGKKNPKGVITCVVSKSDRCDYGFDMENGILLSKWFRYKEEHWTSDSFENIVRVHFGIPLNDEMIKQARTHEGSYDFLTRLSFMCYGEWTDKQKNFLARMLLQNNDLSVYALRHACTTGLEAGVSTKDIEKKIKEIREKYT